jgi:hypothetical protein
MTDHNLKELQRQVDNATSHLKQAKITAEFALKRLHDARCKASGFMGTVVKTRSGKDILVHDVEFLSGDPFRLRGFAFKADGNLGFAEMGVYVSDLPASDPLPSPMKEAAGS